MTVTLIAAFIVLVYALLLIGLGAFSEQAVKWWDARKFTRHVNEALALTKEA